jgi:CRP/FNR family transcriptional regulator, cyclic AMP receptor protein
MNEIMETKDLLRLVPIFSDLNDETLEQISHVGAQRNYSKDALIVSENETGSALYIIIEGKVKISRRSTDGKEVILSILGDSDFFGEMSVIDGLSRSANVVAMEDSVLLIVQRSEFLELLHTHPEVGIALLQELTQRLRTADVKIKSLSLKDSDGKVATVILQLAEDMGMIKNGVVEIEKLPFQHDLANMAGTSRETISRTLSSFEKKGLIEHEGSRLRILNYNKFRETFS